MRTFWDRQLRILSFALLTLAIACGGDSGAPTAPQPQADPDNDGIRGSADSCPNDPETVNGWIDTDGCPDNTVEFYNWVAADLNDFWQAVFVAAGGTYSPVRGFTFYSEPIAACGMQLPRNNALYCLLDERTYYHQPFLDEFMVQIGDAAPAFIIAHEVGHHVSNLLGYYAFHLVGLLSTKFMELQADCWAGAWGWSTAQRGLLETGDLDEAIRTLVAVGDPDYTWFDPTGHGTADQRVGAFLLGFNSGASGACMTLTDPDLSPVPPTASFSFSCSNLTCTFTDGSTDPDGTVVAWSWQFGDGATSNQQSPQHTYAGGGTYGVVLTVTDDDEATDDVMRQVSVSQQNQAPAASFSVVCDLLSCTFTDGSTDSDGTVEAWNWDFGDGSTSTQQSVLHTYSAGGTYSVTLQVADDDGGTGQAVRQVTPNEKPLADFSFLCTGRVCQFADLSSDPDGSITGRNWSFGDGASSTHTNPSHTYAADGNYDVRLIVTDNASAKDTVTRIVGTVQPNERPVAAFNNTCTNLSCDFTDESTDADGTVEGWQWSFGDGSVSSDQNPSHTYAAEGTYTVTLNVTDDDGAASDPAASREISVSPANQGPTADFTFNCVNLVCQFTDASDDPDGTIASRSWDFGDGNSSAQTNPQHAFASKDEYTVKLDVTDNDAATGQISKPVSVNTTPTASILQPANGATFNKGATVQFQGDANDADGDGLTLVWESSLDGTLSGVASFTRSDLSAGVHVISFITSDGTAADTAQRSITIVNQAPTAAISTPVGGSVFNLGSQVGFSGTGTDPEDGTLTGASLVWTSNVNGQIGTGESFTRSDLSAGSHLIRLIATDTDGASDAATVSFRINAPPTATITDPADGSSFTVGTNVSFHGTGIDAEDGSLIGAELVWSSDQDGVFGTGSPNNHSGLSVGVHLIKLIVTDSDGTVGTDQIMMTMTP